jgi:hypothetical protein
MSCEGRDDLMNTQSILSADDGWPSLVKRIERLEKQNRFLRLTSLLSIILLSGVLLMAQSHQEATLTAGRFELVDRAGKVRAALGMTEIGPALLLIDERGTTRVSLNTTATGSSLKLYDAFGEREGGAFEVDASTREFRLHDKSGKIRAGLNIGSNGPALLLVDADEKPRLRLLAGSEGPALELADPAGKTRISLDLEEGSQPGISMFGSTGKPGLLLGIDNRNNSELLLYDSSLILRTQLTAGDPLYTGKVRPGLYLRDPSGRVRVFLYVPETGEPQVLLSDSAGRPRTSLLVSETGSIFALFDPAGHIRASLSLSDTGNPLFALKDADGNLLFSKP